MGQRFLAIFLGVLILNAGTELHQLLKLPQLVEHYFDHRKEDSSISFWNFIRIHYVNSRHPDDNDDREDNELPFKSAGAVYHLDIPVMAKRVTVDFNIYSTSQSFTYHSEGIPNQRSFSVFHPPRSVC